MKRLALFSLSFALALAFVGEASAQFRTLPLLPGRAFLPHGHHIPGHLPGRLPGHGLFPGRGLFPRHVPGSQTALLQLALLQRQRDLALQRALVGRSYYPGAALGLGGHCGGVPASALLRSYGTGGCGGGVPASALFAPGFAPSYGTGGCGGAANALLGRSYAPLLDPGVGCPTAPGAQTQFFFSTRSGY